MKKCYDCGLVFEEPREYTEDLTPDGANEGGLFLHRYSGCPNCGGAYGEVDECCKCGDIAYIEDGTYDCEGFKCETCMINEEIENGDENYEQ